MLSPFQELAQNQFRSAMSLSAVFVNGAGRIAAETSNWLAQTSQNQSSWLRGTVAARSLPELVQAQTDHARANYQAMIDETRKFGAIMSDMLQDAAKASPLQNLGAGTPAAPPSRSPASISPQKRAA